MSSSSSVREELLQNKDDGEYRHAYADENVNLTIGTQLKVLREQREMTQEELANKMGTNQSLVSRYEDVNYGSWSISTLKKYATAFDVTLDVRFRSFGEMVKATEEFSRESLQVPSFADDPFFKEKQQPSLFEIPSWEDVLVHIGSLMELLKKPTTSSERADFLSLAIPTTHDWQFYEPHIRKTKPANAASAAAEATGPSRELASFLEQSELH